MNLIDPNLPTLVLRFTQTDRGFHEKRYNPAMRRVESGAFVSDPALRVGHYEIVRSLRLGQANTRTPDPNSPLYVTEAFTAEMERSRTREQVEHARAARIEPAMGRARPSTSVDEIIDSNSIPISRGRGRQAKTNPMESSM